MIGRRADVRFDFSGTVALVTGSSSGLGLAIARRLGADGARIVVNSRTESRAKETAAALMAEGIEAEGIAADVSDPAQAAALIAQAAARFGRLDILVNNAGQPSVSPAEDLPIAEWQQTIATDLSGPFYCAQAAGRIMLAQGSGVIINVSSIFGLTGNRLRAAYAASKHGLDGLTKVFASEWADRSIRVCSINPGYVATALVQQTTALSQTSMDALCRRSPSGRLGLEHEVADTVAFLASDAASYITGVSLPVDGAGWLMAVSSDDGDLRQQAPEEDRQSSTIARPRIDCDAKIYKQRNFIERMFCRFTDWRRAPLALTATSKPSWPSSPSP